MVKIFIGNLVEGGLVTSDDIRPLFEAHGTVTECEIMKNHGYGFVHMDSEQAAKTAVAELNGRDVKGRNMKVEFSNSKGSGRKNTQKLFIGNIADGTSDQVQLIPIHVLATQNFHTGVEKLVRTLWDSHGV